MFFLNKIMFKHQKFVFYSVRFRITNLDNIAKIEISLNYLQNPIFSFYRLKHQVDSELEWRLYDLQDKKNMYSTSIRLLVTLHTVLV